MLVKDQTAAQLQTNLIEPLLSLEKKFLLNSQSIEDWFQTQWSLTLPPIYGSVDLRNAGFKLAPIDMNLFPAGFNNLNPDFLSISIAAAQKILTQIMPTAKKILIIPESHTRNLFYWANIKTLQTIIQEAGFETRLGMLENGEVIPNTIDLPSGDQVQLQTLIKHSNQLSVDNFIPDLILLNNDLSEGIPEILQNLTQPLIPPAELGWSQRLKSEHFQYYANVADEFAAQFELDPWLISPLFRHCGQIDFMQQDGMECLIGHAEKLFAEIERKYTQYQIPYQPFLIVKADAGTYGMAVMTVRTVDELKSMNRKQRTKMATTKGGQPVNKVIIQEGVYTFETFGEGKSVAEPVVYLMGSAVIGGFYRVHQDRGYDENLNAPGMRFEPIAFQQPCNKPCEKSDPDACQNRFYTYGIIAKLSMLAAAREIKDQTTK